MSGGPAVVYGIPILAAAYLFLRNGLREWREVGLQRFSAAVFFAGALAGVLYAMDVLAGG